MNLCSRGLAILLATCSATVGPYSAADAAEMVAVVSLSFVGEVSEGVQRTTRQRLNAGLAATDTAVTPAAQVNAAVGGQSCDDRNCWRKLWVKLGCRWVIGGRIEGEDRSYAIELWLADARSGKMLARTNDRCDICGLRAMADKVDLTASALRAKLDQAARQPARVLVSVDRPGAMIAVDGKIVGPAPRELILSAGQHEVTARLRGHLTAAQKIQAISGVQDRLSLRLIEAQAPSSPLKTLGWISAGTGIAALGAGIALLAVDGAGIDCEAADRVPGGQCRRLWDTGAGGVTLSVLGTVALAGGGYLLYRTIFGKKAPHPTPGRSAGLPQRLR